MVITIVALPAGINIWKQFVGRRASAARRLHSGYRGREVAISASAALFTVTWLWPHAEPLRPPAIPGLTFVEGAGGSKLAVHVTRASAAFRPPLVVVHGGPAVADMSHDVAAFARLARDRDVYVYDQLGAGRSDRLPDPAGYTEQRMLRDLERVVAFTGRPQVVLLGHSSGARLVTRFAVLHPQRVAGLVLSAPAFPPSPKGGPQRLGDPTTRLGKRERLRLYSYLLRPRNLFTYTLAKVSITRAHEAVGDAEMDARFAEIYRRTTPALFCNHQFDDRLGVTGVGHYAHEALTADTSPLNVPAASPAQSHRPFSAPVLIVKPSCDYLPWATVSASAELFSSAKAVVVPDAGHQAYIEAPDAYSELIRAFLANRPLPFPLVDPRTPPSSYRGTR
ncbi:alpha/beta hydrolase [Kribbella sp. NPDC023855]|uniref:alpha/beta hydrolase n=1 Tax=Kribbella sp. NPDC023855 TaxID=3154698 RepID=UPI0034114C1A